jgi:hypothetical protein
MSGSETNKAPEAITQPLPRGVADAIKEAEWLRGHVAAGKTLRIWQKHIVDLDDYAHTLQSSLERTERELREAREALEALKKHVRHSQTCARPSGAKADPAVEYTNKCTCGASAALSNPSNPEKGES